MHLAGSSGDAGTSSSWLTAHSARTKITTASPFSTRLHMYSRSMSPLPGPSAQSACMRMLWKLHMTDKQQVPEAEEQHSLALTYCQQHHMSHIAWVLCHLSFVLVWRLLESKCQQDDKDHR